MDALTCIGAWLVLAFPAAIVVGKLLARVNGDG